jgi:peptidoglycan lytic transglycosylase
MSSVNGARTSCVVDAKASRIFLAPPAGAIAGVRDVIQWLALAVGAASLAACAQSSNKSELLAHGHQAPVEHNRSISSVPNKRVAVTKKHTPFSSDKHATETQVASRGLASFYSEGTQTASGEKFDMHQLTAAHPTLPFGTRLRVTNVATGRAVTVRVNDRGPFVPGRIVDVSYAAAETLGMVGGGVAKVKLDVVP